MMYRYGVKLDDGNMFAYFVMVDGEANANRIYEMRQVSPYEFEASYGREGGHTTTKRYPMHKWDSTARNRTKPTKKPRPYEDRTELRVSLVQSTDGNTSPSPTTGGIADSVVRKLFDILQGFSSKSVQSNYRVSSAEVTQEMIDLAQDTLDQISGLIYTPDIIVSNSDINDLLEELYSIVPRKMKKVRDHLLPVNPRHLDLQDAKYLFNLEQSNLDVMSQQVSAQKPVHVAKSPDPSDEVSILDKMGIKVRVATAAEALQVKALAPRNASKIGTVYAVENATTQTAFDEHMIDMAAKTGNDKVRMLVADYWHGSRTENWLNILQKGLLIRPPGAHTTGDMFGIGIYFADKFSKSFNYVGHRNSYYGGSSNIGFMGVYRVHIGKQYEVGRHNYSCYDLSASKLANLGNYDSVWGKSGPSLLNNEFIIYTPVQCTIAYLIQVR